MFNALYWMQFYQLLYTALSCWVAGKFSNQTQAFDPQTSVSLEISVTSYSSEFVLCELYILILSDTFYSTVILFCLMVWLY